MRPALQAEQPVPSNKTLVMLLLGIVLVGANMRAAIASVGPLIGFIRDDTGLSNGAVGWLTTIPLIGFAVLSPFAPSLARRYGTERTLVATLALMTIGIGLRAFDSVPLLFVGTAGVGIGIAVCNVLLPSIVKQNFINRVGFMTGLYSMTMSIFASIAAGISVPLSQGAGWGWRNTLLVWAALSLLGLLIWLPMARSSQARGGVERSVPALARPRMYGSPVWPGRLRSIWASNPSIIMCPSPGCRRFSSVTAGLPSMPAGCCLSCS